MIVGVQMLYRLPAPEHCSRSQLLRWLVLRDVSAESPPTQLALVDRLAQELLARDDDGLVTASGGANWLVGDQVRQNANLLKQVWFTSRVDRFHALPAAQRPAWLDEQIAIVSAWTMLQQRLSSSEDGSSGNRESSSAAQDSGTAAFFADIREWIATAEPAAAARMQQAVNAALVRWLSTQDLAEQSLATRQAIAERIATQLDRGLKPSEQSAGMTGDESSRLRANGMLLLEAWLTSQARRYQQLAPAEQNALVDEQIDRVGHWGIARWLTSNSNGEPAAPFAGPLAQLQLIAIVNSWVERAEPEDQPALRELVQAVQVRMLSRLVAPPANQREEASNEET